MLLVASCCQQFFWCDDDGVWVGRDRANGSAAWSKDRNDFSVMSRIVTQTPQNAKKGGSHVVLRSLLVPALVLPTMMITTMSLYYPGQRLVLCRYVCYKRWKCILRSYVPRFFLKDFHIILLLWWWWCGGSAVSVLVLMSFSSCNFEAWCLLPLLFKSSFVAMLAS